MTEEPLINFTLKCDKCGYEIYCEETSVWKFCPVCGASVRVTLDFEFDVAEVDKP